MIQIKLKHRDSQSVSMFLFVSTAICTNYFTQFFKKTPHGRYFVCHVECRRFNGRNQRFFVHVSESKEKAERIFSNMTKLIVCHKFIFQPNAFSLNQNRRLLYAQYRNICLTLFYFYLILSVFLSVFRSETLPMQWMCRE